MRLTPEQLRSYSENGYLSALPALSRDEAEEARKAYHKILDMLPDGVKIFHLSQWEKKNDFVFRICSHPNVLDYAESIVGPDFYVWDAYFFAKEPRADWVSQFHTDVGSWPMSEGKYATVFLAITDTTSENGCLRVVRGSHVRGQRHVTRDFDKNRELFHHEVPDEDIDPADIVDLELEAGQCSMHHERIVHGSGPNRTDGHRVGLAMRFASFDVQANLNMWPQFSVIPVRGTDRYHRNHVHPEPRSFGIPSPEDEPHFRSPAIGARLKRAWRKVRRPGGPVPQIDTRAAT